MSGSDDFFTALAGLKQAGQELSLKGAISDANDQLQQAKMQINDEAQRTQAVRDIASNLTMRMISSGANAGQIDAASKAITQPLPNVQNPFEGFVNPQTRASTQQYMDIEQANKMELQKQKGHGDLALAKLMKAQSDHADTEFDKYAKLAPDQNARNAAGVAVQNIQRANALSALFPPGATAKDLNDANKIQVQDAAMSLSKMLTGGVVSEGEIKQLFPNTASMKKADLLSYLESKPVPANVGEFVKFYLDAADREKNVAHKSLYDSVLEQAQGHARLHDLDPAQFKEMAASRLQKFAGVTVSPEEIDVKGRHVDVKLGGQDADRYQRALAELRQARTTLQRDPNNADALSTFKKAKIAPDSAVDEIKSKLKFDLLRYRKGSD
jgi:hypothetical protein